MKQTAIIMGMPVTVEINNYDRSNQAIADTFNYFRNVDNRFSTYKPGSEISRINRGLDRLEWSEEMCWVIDLCDLTKRQTKGYFDIARNGQLDPSGLVKGWSINHAAQKLLARGVKDFYIDAGGDVQASGVNSIGEPWRIGIRNPFDTREIVKIIQVDGLGVATSGTYVRGQHIYNPRISDQKQIAVKSLTVIGSNIYEADRFATAAFAMGREGINFIESLPDLEGYMIDDNKTATLTSGFERFVYA